MRVQKIKRRLFFNVTVSTVVREVTKVGIKSPDCGLYAANLPGLVQSGKRIVRVFSLIQVNPFPLSLFFFRWKLGDVLPRFFFGEFFYNFYFPLDAFQ